MERTAFFLSVMIAFCFCSTAWADELSELRAKAESGDANA